MCRRGACSVSMWSDSEPRACTCIIDSVQMCTGASRWFRAHRTLCGHWTHTHGHGPSHISSQEASSAADINSRSTRLPTESTVPKRKAGERMSIPMSTAMPPPGGGGGLFSTAFALPCSSITISRIPVNGSGAGFAPSGAAEPAPSDCCRLASSAAKLFSRSSASAQAHTGPRRAAVPATKLGRCSSAPAGSSSKHEVAMGRRTTHHSFRGSGRPGGHRKRKGGPRVSMSGDVEPRRWPRGENERGVLVHSRRPRGCLSDSFLPLLSVLGAARTVLYLYFSAPSLPGVVVVVVVVVGAESMALRRHGAPGTY